MLLLTKCIHTPRISLCAKACRTMTSGYQGTKCFRRYDRDLGSKPTISLKRSWGGYLRTTLLRLSICVNGSIQSSALITVLLVYFENLLYCLFSCYHLHSLHLFHKLRVRFPYFSCAYSRLGTITFVRIQIVILVSRCESATTASIFSTCDLSFGNTFVSCVVHDPSFGVFTQMCAC